MRSIVPFLVTAVLFAGCTTVQEKPIELDKLLSFKGKTLSITKREQQDFYKLTPKLESGGLIGALTARSEGNKFVKENNISDPAFDINKKLAIALEERYGIVNTNKIIEVSGGKIEEIAAKSPDTSLILDFQTIGWRIGHADERCFFCSKDYVVTFNNGDYFSKAVLIDVESKTILAETGCLIYLTKETDEKMPLEKVTKNQAELLKVMFAKASDDCMNKVKTELFGIKQ